MPSLKVTANTSVQSVAAEVRNGVHKPTSITIDNINGGGTRVLQVQDGFTPSATHGTASPSATTVNRLQITALAGDLITLSEEDLKGVKCLGSLGIISDVTDASCYISVGYKTE
jgi:hypothetical protein